MVFDKEKLQKILEEKKLETTEDLQDLLRDTTKELIEAVYDGEITDHLGYKKYEQKPGNSENSQNGHSTKKVKSKVGEI